MTQETKKELNDLYLIIKSKIDDKNEPEAIREHNKVKLDLIMQLSRTLKRDACKSAFMQKIAIESFVELCNEIKTLKQLERKKIIASRFKLKKIKPLNIGMSPHLENILRNKEFVFNHLSKKNDI